MERAPRFTPLAFALAWPLLAACAGPQARKLASPFRAPSRLALLPVANQSVDMRASELMRGLMFSALSAKGYALVPLGKVDQALHEMGIHEAGQLPVATPQELGRRLGADGLVYGTVEDFAFQNLGYYQNWKVAAVFRMLEASSGAVLWEDQAQASRKAIHLDQEEARRAFEGGLAQQVIQKTMGHTKLGRAIGIEAPLEEQARQVVWRLMQTLPSR